MNYRKEENNCDIALLKLELKINFAEERNIVLISLPSSSTNFYELNNCIGVTFDNNSCKKISQNFFLSKLPQIDSARIIWEKMFSHLLQ